MGKETALRSREVRANFAQWFSTVFGSQFPASELRFKYLENQGYTWGTSEIFRNNLWWLKWNNSLENYQRLNLSSLRSGGDGLLSFDRNGGIFVFLSPSFFVKLVYQAEESFPPFVFADHFLDELQGVVKFVNLATIKDQGIFYERTLRVGKDRCILGESASWAVWNHAGTRMVLGKKEAEVGASLKALHGFLSQDLSSLDAANSAVRILPQRCTLAEWVVYRETEQISDHLLKPVFAKPLKKVAYIDPERKMADQRMMLAQLGNEFLVWNEPRLRSGGFEFAFSDLLKNAKKFGTLSEAESYFEELPKNLKINPVYQSEPIIENSVDQFRLWFQEACAVEFPFYLPENLIFYDKEGVRTWHNIEAYVRRTTSEFVYGHDIQIPLFPDQAIFEFVESKGYLHLMIKYGHFSLGYRSMAIASNIDISILARLGEDLTRLKDMVAAYYQDGVILNIFVDMERALIGFEDEKLKSYVYGSADHNLKSLHAVMVSGLTGHRRVKTGGAYGIRTENGLPYESWMRHVEQIISDTPTTDWEIIK